MRPDSEGAADVRLPKPPRRKQRRDPRFRTTLVTVDTLNSLRKLQKRMNPRLSLKFISEACHRIALQQGGEEVMRVAELLAQEPA